MEKSPESALQSMADAIEHIRAKMYGITLETFQGDLDRRRIVERSIEIISEVGASGKPGAVHTTMPDRAPKKTGNPLSKN